MQLFSDPNPLVPSRRKKIKTTKFQPISLRRLRPWKIKGWLTPCRHDHSQIKGWLTAHRWLCTDHPVQNALLFRTLIHYKKLKFLCVVFQSNFFSSFLTKAQEKMCHCFFLAMGQTTPAWQRAFRLRKWSFFSLHQGLGPRGNAWASGAQKKGPSNQSNFSSKRMSTLPYDQFFFSFKCHFQSSEQNFMAIFCF